MDTIFEKCERHVTVKLGRVQHLAAAGCGARRQARAEGRHLTLAVKRLFVCVPGVDFPACATVTRPWAPRLPPPTGATQTVRYKLCFREW